MLFKFQLNCYDFHSEPSIRGVLLAGAGIATTIGIFFVYLLGAILTWRQVALICGIVPAVNILVAVFVCFIYRKRKLPS